MLSKKKKCKNALCFFFRFIKNSYLSTNKTSLRLTLIENKKNVFTSQPKYSKCFRGAIKCWLREGVTVATIRFNPSSLSTQTFLPSKIVRSLKRHLDIHNIQMTSLRRPLKAFMRRFYQKWNKDLS